MTAFGITDQGKVRTENQDSFGIRQTDDGTCSILVLCDGMGGAHAGKTASSLAVDTFLSSSEELLRLSRDEELSEIIRGAAALANANVYEKGTEDPDCQGMGTTMVAAIIRPEDAAVANIGDSRCYWLRNGKMRQITRDHSLVQNMIDQGALTPEEARTHPRKNIITRAVGLDKKVKCDVFLPRLREEDMLLFCSDGLSNMVTPREILDSVRGSQGPEEACHKLLDLALRRGAPDNVTILIFVR